MKRARIVCSAAALVLSLAGEAMADTPDAALRTRNPRLGIQWAAPDLRPAPFERIMLEKVELEFRAVAPMTGPTGTNSTRTEFPVPERSRERIAAIFDEVLRDELGDNRRFTLTDEAGPGVLVLRPALRDIVSRIPPEEPAGSGRTYVDTVGDATLVVTFIDAATGQVLGTATDRRTARPAGSVGGFGALWATPVNTGFEVRRLARHWGMSLERRVEQLYFDAKPR